MNCRSCGKEVVKLFVDGYQTGDTFICSTCQSGYTHFGVKKTKEPQLLLGCEIEVELPCGGYTSRYADEVVNTNPKFFNWAGDGSLNNGVEFRTAPATLWWLKENEKVLDPLFNLVHEGFRAYQTQTAGFHVHLSTCALSVLTLHKMFTFVESNEAFIRTVSCRRENNFNCWTKLTGNPNEYKHRCFNNTVWDPRTGTYKKRKISTKNTQETKEALLGNFFWLRKNKRTAEIRLFRGNLSRKGFRRNTEFCHSLVEFAKNHSIVEASSLDKYIDFVSSYNYYSNISSFIDSNYTREGQ